MCCQLCRRWQKAQETNTCDISAPNSPLPKSEPVPWWVTCRSCPVCLLSSQEPDPLSSRLSADLPDVQFLIFAIRKALLSTFAQYQIFVGRLKTLKLPQVLVGLRGDAKSCDHGDFNMAYTHWPVQVSDNLGSSGTESRQQLWTGY